MVGLLRVSARTRDQSHQVLVSSLIRSGLAASQPSTPLNHQPGNALNPEVSAYHTGVGDRVSAPYSTPVSPFVELAK